MDIANGASKGDVVLKKDGVTVFLDKQASKMLSKATMDYSSKEGIIITGIPRSCCG